MTQIALVTGASRGIGRAIAHQLARQGMTVIGTATSEEGAHRIEEGLKEKGFNGAGMCLDVTDNASVDSVIAEINERFGVPTVLINNAGITRDSLLARMKESQWDEVMDANLKSVYRVSKACLKGMTKLRYGRIISISSVVAGTGNFGQSNYAAAKAGVEAFTRSLAREVAMRNITVNAVAPGFIATEMTEVLPDVHREALLAQIPMSRLGKPEEIAAVVGFIASDVASYVTGEVIQANGGMNMR